jgi:hypothetical protein
VENGAETVRHGVLWLQLYRFIAEATVQNEYAKQIKAYRQQEKPGQAYGKVFVKGAHF